MPMPNPLAAQVGLRAGPILLETLVKHYFDRIRAKAESDLGTKLRQEELLYDEAFTVIKMFLETSSYHTVEDVQAFANNRTPSPPWVRVLRIMIPMPSCDEAAKYLIAALGGEEMARKVAGGTKWWQARGVKGIEAEWIATRKDWQEAERKYKARDASKGTAENQSTDSAPAEYEEDLDEMRCILYTHGGGYFFGSVDQERYSIQRHARKIHGRVFAVNYRLAPQFPFPCALQDVLAAYLYLIRPPPEAEHKPVKPENIVVAGDSAGGGLTLALLQVLRDADLPLPAGGVLISPWCDLTHSFPSIHTNTSTDVMPPWGLSFQKPSTLWPPPSPDMTSNVQKNLRSRIRQKLHVDHSYFHRVNSRAAVNAHPDHIARTLSRTESTAPMPVNVGATSPMPMPIPEPPNHTIELTTAGGEKLMTDAQLHMYAPNNLLVHPLVSPALSYLGGLPPLLFIASDKEVLRDEILYAAHKAAYPERFPVKEQSRALYPMLEGIESRYGPTAVHLQVYDDTAHVLPVLFSFTTPAKFCFRAIASFCREVTNMDHASIPSEPSSGALFPLFQKSSLSRRGTRKARSQSTLSSAATFDPAQPLPPLPNSDSLLAHKAALAPEAIPEIPMPPPQQPQIILEEGKRVLSSPENEEVKEFPKTEPQRAASMDSERRSRSTRNGRLSTIKRSIRKHSKSLMARPPRADRIRATEKEVEGSNGTVGSSSVNLPRSTSPDEALPRLAGDPTIYNAGWKGQMIRERVSTQGVIRQLEPEIELPSLALPLNVIGEVSELVLKRFFNARDVFNAKFSSTIKTIEKRRIRHLEKAAKEGDKDRGNVLNDGTTDKDSWIWAWALDGKENPPPSSIVSRRDTELALELAKSADQATAGHDESVLSGNNLWQMIVSRLSAGPQEATVQIADENAEASGSQRKPKSKFSRIFSGDFKAKEVEKAKA